MTDEAQGGGVLPLPEGLPRLGARHVSDDSHPVRLCWCEAFPFEIAIKTCSPSNAATFPASEFRGPSPVPLVASLWFTESSYLGGQGTGREWPQVSALLALTHQTRAGSISHICAGGPWGCDPSPPEMGSPVRPSRAGSQAQDPLTVGAAPRDVTTPEQWGLWLS